MAGPYYTKIPASTIGSGTYRGLYVVSSTYAVGDIVVPTVAYGTAAAKGYIYRCTTGGTTSGSEPTWVYTTPGTSTTTDTAVFTCENATTWAYASPRPDYIINNKLAAGEIVYSENGAYPVTAATTIIMPGTQATPSSWISTSDTANAPPTSIATGAVIDGSATSALNLAVQGKGYLYGIGLTSGGSTGFGAISLANLDESNLHCEECSFTIANTHSGSVFVFGVDASLFQNTSVITKKCTFITGNSTSQGYTVTANWQDYGSTFSVTTAIPATVFKSSGANAEFYGSDFSALTGSTSYVGGSATRFSRFTFVQCKLGASITLMATQTGMGHHEVFVYDSSSGDNHYEFAHYNYLGNTTISTAIYMSGTDGASYNAANTKHSWKVTSVNGTFETPYISPWISRHNEATSAVTPRLEVLRDGSTTAYKTDEVWPEFAYKGTTGSTCATIDNTGRCAILTHNAGSAGNQASSALGASDWAGETTPWYGKLEPSGTITPAEIGDIAARVCVTGSNTVYVNPVILGV